MQLKYRKIAFAAVWVVAMCAVGIAANVTSLFGWTVLVCLALLPPIVMLRLWNDPAQSMSESIQKALR
jgi:hypothetical protein